MSHDRIHRHELRRGQPRRCSADPWDSRSWDFRLSRGACAGRDSSCTSNRDRRSLAVEQLTTLDAGFLEAEDSDRHVSLAIGGLAVVDGPAPDYDVLVATLGERVPSIPRFTQVLHTHLFAL